MLDETANVRRRIAGLGLIGAPLLLGVGEALRLSTDRAALELEVAGLTDESPTTFMAMGFFEVGALILFFPALLAILHLFRRRSAPLGHLAVGLLVVGVACHTTAMTLLAVANWAAVDLTQSSDVPITGDATGIGLSLAYANTLETPLSLLVVVALVTLFGGLLALANAVWTSRLFRRWTAVALAGAAVASLFEWDNYADVIPYALVSIGLGSMGWKVFTMTTSEWEKTGGTAPLAAQERF